MLQDRLMLFGVAALTAVATAGWMRQPQVAAAAPQALSIPVNSFVPPADIALDPGFATAPPLARPASAPVAKSSPRTSQQSTRYRYSEPELRERTAEERPEPVAPEPVVKKERSKLKSAAIIGGGAAAGAAVGGLAGGKKGAAIGAIGGGVAGLVYDRMTKNN
jgi:hypothetical protein